ncbi:uracil phosphoribosyltransferase [Pseudoalteromonas denitrificans]|uniref:Uracil phosphoribosyltransferase n=1 Tax=Pseudoalteromonas denitrificans DSM 6059 TaxID=1123010 RepID=A0A1I1KTK0_9GAMM|nr:uracil phosphoribosyltransferase [Pseudoalteromonas denitrificans]SFC61483.1 uracil phosphoribosyltransferase [Pseudoalteromonas denitrificans DSM 6059]
MEKLTIISHPVLQHKLTLLRKKETKSCEFRRLLNEISGLLAYESTKELALIDVDIQTPLESMQGQEVKQAPIIVSIMRAGNGMLDGLLNMLPFASAGHIGIYRDKFIQNTVEYYFRLPKEVAGKEIILADPLLATGDTALACIDRLKQYNVGKITMICILVSQQGVDKLHHFHPDVNIIAIGKERELNEDGHLLPGLGDAGDRLYKTID